MEMIDSDNLENLRRLPCSEIGGAGNQVAVIGERRSQMKDGADVRGYSSQIRFQRIGVLKDFRQLDGRWRL